jgi:putative transposase
MLDYAEAKPEMLESMLKSGKSLRKEAASIIDNELLKRLNDFNVQPFKDSLKIEFVNLIESFLRRRIKNEGARFPRIIISSEGLIEKIENHKVGRRSLDRLCDKLGPGKTIYFCRYSDHRDYSLLYDPYKKRFFAKLYLLNQHDILKRTPYKNPGSLLKIVGKNELLAVSGRPERFIILPLSFGKEQESLLTEALNKPGMLKTARLIKKNNEYYLAINVAIEAKESHGIESYAGFSMPNGGRIFYSVCGLNGELLYQGEIPCGYGTDPLPERKDCLHIIANRIVEVCYKYKAQAVFETFPLYNSLVGILDYKLPIKGLQRPVRVSPFGLWQACPKCGNNSKKNRVTGGVFLCAACGFGTKQVFLPSYNLAKRLIKYHNDKVCFICVKDRQEGRTAIINPLLDIEYHIGSNRNIDDFFEFIHLRTEEIRELLNNRETEWTKNERKIFSIWNKLLTAKNIRDVIEIEN